MYDRAVRVPVGEVRVLRARARVVSGAVEASVVAVHVGEDVGVQERVIERRVEDATLVHGSALDSDSSEPVAPSRVGLTAHGLEIPHAVFGAQVHARVLDADERNADLHLQRPLAHGVE